MSALRRYGAAVAVLLVPLAAATPAGAATDGTLQPLGCISSETVAGCTLDAGLRGIRQMEVSPDGRQLFVAVAGANQLVVYGRNPTTGALTGREQCVAASVAGCLAVPTLDQPNDVAITPDGANVFVTESASVVVLNRTANGILSYSGCYGGSGCSPGLALPISPSHPTGGASTSRTATRRRGPPASISGCWLRDVWPSADCKATTGMAGANDVAATPDGRRVFAANLDFGGNLVVFDRAANGMLTQLPLPYGCLGPVAGCGALTAPLPVTYLAVAPNSRSVHVAGQNSGLTASPARVWTFRIDRAGIDSDTATSGPTRPSVP